MKLLHVSCCLFTLAWRRASGRPKHLIVSSPAQSKVFFSNTTESIADPNDVELVLDAQGKPMVPPLQMNMLISPAVVEEPMGLAIERQKRMDVNLGYEVEDRYLFVADAAPKKKCVSRFPLYESFGHFTAGPPQEVLRDKMVRWIAVDYLGNLFATCEETGEILKVPAENIRNNLLVPPIVLYRSSGPNGLQVTAPGGIAVDSFSLFWSNKVVGGPSTGSVVRGTSFMPAGRITMPSVVPIAKNADAGKDYGVCVAGQTVFYSEKKNKFYAVGKDGGAIAIISDQLKEPRGCAWDRDNTIYVADRKAGRIYSFAGAMRNLRTVGKLKSASMLTDPFDVVVIDAAPALSLLLPWLLALLSAVFTS